jgi:hypothetical protein
MRALDAKGLLGGRKLDYGCGKGMDAQTYGMDKYDPHYAPELPEGPYDTITCNYVLNVIESFYERELVIASIRELLAPGGRAYITVRNDKGALNGETKRGTWQGHIELDAPIIQETRGYVTYLLQ